MPEDFEIDFQRSTRLGFPEVIYGAGKTPETLRSILLAYRARGQNALVTKLQPAKAAALQPDFPTAFFDPVSGAYILDPVQADPAGPPQVAILSGGSSDAPAVNEAYHTLRFCGVPADRVPDIGIAGIHRLLGKLDALRRYRVLIVAAGFEGALPTAVGGLLPQPIIALPTSVGYGVAAGGRVALDAMLSSCANGIAVVNIDNGYGAAIAALRILRSLQS